MENDREERGEIEMKAEAEDVWRYIEQLRERRERERGERRRRGVETGRERELHAVQPLCAVEQQPVRH